MIVVGGATRLTDSGLSITEWKPLMGTIPPLSQSQWLEVFEKYKTIPEYHLINKGMGLEDFKYIFWWEWAHRFLGRIIGIAFAVPLFIFYAYGFLNRSDLWKFVGVFALGGLQGAIGWYMVSSGLVDRVDVSHYRLALHLTVAFLILGLVVWLIMEQHDPSRAIELKRVPKEILPQASILVLLVYLQVFVGALVAGLKAGLVYNTWPLMNGAVFPNDLFALSPWFINFFENTTTVQFTHRLTAYLLVGFGLWHTFIVLKSEVEGEVRTSALFLAGALFVQMCVGILTLVQGVPIMLGCAHQGLAAIVLMISIRHLWLVYKTTIPREALALA